MMTQLKSLGSETFGIIAAVALFMVPVLLLNGAVWASEYLLPLLISLGYIALTLDIVILLPLSVFRRLRPFTGGAIMLSSILFGAVTFLCGLVVTYSLWGVFAVVGGLMFFGVGPVFLALIASMLNGRWDVFVSLLVLGVVTLGSRMIGALLVCSEPTQSVKQEDYRVSVSGPA